MNTYLEGFDLRLPLAQEPQGHALNPPSAPGPRKLAPQDRTDVEADLRRRQATGGYSDGCRSKQVPGEKPLGAGGRRVPFWPLLATQSTRPHQVVQGPPSEVSVDQLLADLRGAAGRASGSGAVEEQPSAGPS